MSADAPIPHHLSYDEERAYTSPWFRALIEKSADAITLVDNNAVILYMSSAIYHILGYEPQTLLGQNAFTFMHPDDVTVNKLLFTDLVQHLNHSHTFTFRLQHQDTSWRWVEGVLTNYLSDPHIGAIVGNYRDITDRKQAEAQLIESENRYRALMQEASDIILLTHTNGHILEANERASEILGYTQEELCNFKTIDLLHPEDSSANSVQERAQQIKEGKRVRAERRVRHKNGHYIFIEGTGNLLSDGRVVNIWRDITARKQVEQELRASEQRYRLVVEYSSDIISLMDTQGNWFYISPAAERILGYTPIELTAINAFQLIHPDDLSLTQNSLQLALKGERVSAIYRYKHKHGHWVFLETNGSAIFDELGQPTMLVFTSHDVTDRLELEKRKDEFISTTSHELRSPLTTIKASLQLAQRQFRRIPDAPVEDVIKRVQDMLALAERQVTVENRLVSDLLDVSRIQQNKLELLLKLCNLRHVVSSVVADQQAIEQRRTISLLLPELEMLPVIADVDRIGQVISNYITNAIKYSPQDKPIEVRLELIEGKARVSVRDEGAGINLNEQSHIWERFYQSPSRQISKGSSGLGLGLYICRTIIEQHQGEVGIESTPGQGSTFWFALPIVNE